MSNQGNRRYKKSEVAMDGKAMEAILHILQAEVGAQSEHWPRPAMEIIQKLCPQGMPIRVFVQNFVVRDLVYLYILYSILFDANLRSLDLIQI